MPNRPPKSDEPPARNWRDLFEFPDPSGLSALEVIEQNRDFYEANIREAERQYGGQFVRDKALAHCLIQAMQVEAALRGGTVSRQIHLSGFPAEEFVAIPIVFEVTISRRSFPAKKWYFVRRPRLFVGAKSS